MIKRVFFNFLLLLLPFSVYSQSEAVKTDIISELERSVNGANVTIYQDAKVDSLLKTNTAVSKERFVAGYRIQVFSDNSQKKAKEEAQWRASEIERFDNALSAYITFNSPFWRVRVGDFKSYEEATIKLRELKSAFPHYSDIRIVKDNIIEKD